MANRRLPMRKIKEILRLHFQARLSARQIARSCSVSRATVGDYLSRTRAAQLDWKQVAQMSEAELEGQLFPPPAPRGRHRPPPDLAYVHRELRGKSVTLQLLWQEYKQVHADGYQYSQFCDLYNRWRGKLDVVLRQNHRAGEKMFVDYAGQTVEIVDPKTGEMRQASIFVAVLGASNYTYAEATESQNLQSWIGAHVRAVEFFGGTTRVVIPDNTRTAVSQACFYEPQINPSYAEWAAHYSVAVIPARVRAPRDKGKVESAVLVVERWILAAVRKRRFFSLGELNQASTNCLGNSTAGLSANLRAIAWSSSGVWISPLSDPYPGSVISWLAGRKLASTSITTSSSSATTTASPMLWSASRSRSVTRNTSWRSCTGASGWPRIVATACQEPPLPAPSTVHSVTGVIWSGLLRG